MKVRILTLFAWPVAVFSQSVFMDQDAAGIVNRAIIIPRQQFNRTHVEALCRSFLKEHEGNYKLLRLLIGTDEFDLARSLYHSINRPLTAKSALEDLKKFGLPKQPIARLFARGGRALVSYIGPDGKFDEWLLLGASDPTSIKLGDVTCRLLHLHFSGPEYAMRKDFVPKGPPKDPYVVDLYFQCGPRVSATNAATLTRMFAKELGRENVTVHTRSDTWFVEDPQFPDVYRFQRQIVVPMLYEALGRPSVSCSVGGPRGLGCAGTSFVP
jgi:hypothetical protein